MATIAEIRAQFPQYADLSDSQLADAMHKKFYADMPREVFYQKVGLKADTPEGRSTAAQVARAVALPVKGLENSVLETVGAIPDLVSAGFRGFGIPAPAPGAYTQGLKSLLMPGAAAARRLRVAAGIKNERMRADTKASARRLLEGLRDLRQIIGQDGYRLP